MKNRVSAHAAVMCGALIGCLSVGVWSGDVAAQSSRVTPSASTTPLVTKGRVIYVDPAKGNDQSSGSEAAPLRSLKTAVGRLMPGDTLLLMSGVYREPLYVAVRGTSDKPITIRSAPGNLAIIDGGIGEFHDTPESAWTPVAGSDGEYISTNVYPNARDLIGCMVDGYQGLQTYWHRKDLTAKSELWVQPKGQDVEPVYVGPGIWYDAQSGRVHARLAPTNLKGIENYAGPSDPRKVRMILAPFRALPLHLDGAQNVVLRDLFIRGGGYDTVVIDNCRDIRMEGLTIRAGTYGVRVSNTRGLKFLGSSVLGNAAPWVLRQENSLRDRPGANMRDIARLTSHALWVPDSGREFSVYAFPVNDDFEIGYSLFADCHDGVYLGGVTTDFHHNIVDNCHDDGLYLSPMYPFSKATLRVRENLLRRCLTPFAFGGLDTTQDTVLIYRNIVDQRYPVNTSRPAVEGNPVGSTMGQLFGDHGSPIWPTMAIYQNTFVLGQTLRHVHGAAYLAVNLERPRTVLNNLFIHLDKLPGYVGPQEPKTVIADGNLFWSPNADEKALSSLFTRYRASEVVKKAKEAGVKMPDEGSVLSDPKVELPPPTSVAGNRWSSTGFWVPAAASPARSGAVALPASLPDVQGVKPVIGALGDGFTELKVGPGFWPGAAEAIDR